MLKSLRIIWKKPEDREDIVTNIRFVALIICSFLPVTLSIYYYKFSNWPQITEVISYNKGFQILIELSLFFGIPFLILLLFSGKKWKQVFLIFLIISIPIFTMIWGEYWSKVAR